MNANPDPVLPTIDISGLDPMTAAALNQFSADLQSFFIDQANAFGLLSAANAFSATAQQPLVASAFSQWTNQPYVATDYSTLGTPSTSWTVAAEDVFTNRYLVIGKTLFWQVITRSGGAIGGTPSEIFINLPAGLRSNTTVAGAGVIGFAVAAGSDALMLVRPAGTAVALDLTSGSTWATSARVNFLTIIELA